MQKHILTIGGMDPIGASGISCDLRVIQGLQHRGFQIVTCVTAQNSERWIGADAMSGDSLLAQFRAIRSHAAIDVIKVGMVTSLEHLRALEVVFEEFGGPIVFDPVFGPSSHDALWTAEMVGFFLERLAPYLTIVTPNLLEARQLVQRQVQNKERPFGEVGDDNDDCALAERLGQLGFEQVLLKGGHRQDGTDCVADLLWGPLGFWRMETPVFDGAYRGTGCFLASAIACFIAEGHLVCDAVLLAKSYLLQGLSGAKSEHLGHILAAPVDDRPRVELLLEEGGRSKVWFARGDADVGAKGGFEPMGGEPIGAYVIVAHVDELLKLIDSGVSTFQLRIKDVVDPEVLGSMVARAIEIAKNAGVRLFINDFWELALEHEAYGVHLGQEDLQTADLARIRNAGLRLGISSHCYVEALLASRLKPSYIALGPIFATTCKSMAFGPRGFEMVQEWSQMFCDTPIVAIGGLKLEHIGDLRVKGASGFAVISDVLQAPDPMGRARDWARACVL